MPQQRRQQVDEQRFNSAPPQTPQTEVEASETPFASAAERVAEKRNALRRVLLIIGAVIVLAGLIFWFRDTLFSVFQSTDPEQQTQEEVLALVEQVGRHIVLPAEEIPLVATVVDAAALEREQPFYDGVQEGDRLLIYGTSMKAILYSPQRDRLLNVGPVQVPGNLTQEQIGESETTENDGEVQAMDTSTEDTRLTVDIRNGTDEAGAAAQLSVELGDEYTVVTTRDAASDTYPRSLIVDQTNGARAEEVNALAQRVNATVIATLPFEEVTSSADVILILGG